MKLAQNASDDPGEADEAIAPQNAELSLLRGVVLHRVTFETHHAVSDSECQSSVIQDFSVSSNRFGNIANNVLHRFIGDVRNHVRI